MKKLLYLAILFLALGSVVESAAQTITLQNRTPRFKKVKWLNGNAPKRCAFTYIEFIHSASEPCRIESERIYEIVREMENVAFILVSSQGVGEIDEWVMSYITPRAGVVVDDKHIRSAYGVSYAPFGVIIDHKRRALWFGNPRMLDREEIRKFVATCQ